VTLRIDLGPVGGSSLTDRSLPLPEFAGIDGIEPGIPSTYVPFRNGIFLALAAAWAEAHGIRDIVCGFNVIDSPHYPDTRPAFVAAMERAVNVGTSASASGLRMRIVAPFIRLKKAEIIRRGLSLGADYSSSVSCYRGEEVPCGKCSSCLLRARAFGEAGAADPLLERLKRKRKT
jgi:7-cyano-7-deazaguanine synthase